jgi:hypothetical protein
MRQILLAVLLTTSATLVWAQEPLGENQPLEEAQPAEEKESVEEAVSEAEPNGNGVDSP